MGMQMVLQAVFPPECLSCGARVDADFSICGPCWSQTPFILGAACHLCGVGLPGQDPEPGEDLVCEECHTTPRPWSAGRAVMHYADTGRSLVLGLKHGDRADIARGAGAWLARAGADLFHDDPLLVPIPLHWRRLIKRRYNQAGLLAHWLARETGLTSEPQALVRYRNTGSQDGLDRDGRFRNVDSALRAHPRRGAALNGRAVVLIDDVMTSGATFSAATEACHRAGAADVRVLSLARVAKDT